MNEEIKEKKANYIKLYIFDDYVSLLLGDKDTYTIAHQFYYAKKEIKYMNRNTNVNDITKHITSEGYDYPINEFKYLYNIKKFCYFGLPHLKYDGSVMGIPQRQGLSVVVEVLYEGGVSNLALTKLNKYYTRLRNYNIKHGL